MNDVKVWEIHNTNDEQLLLKMVIMLQKKILKQDKNNVKNI